MGTSGRPSRDTTDPPDDARRAGFTELFWTEERQAALRDILRRLGMTIILLLLALAWAAVATLEFLDRVLAEERPTSGGLFFVWLLPGIALFALSVVPLVDRRAPNGLRVAGVLYAIFGLVMWLALIDIA